MNPYVLEIRVVSTPSDARARTCHFKAANRHIISTSIIVPADGHARSGSVDSKHFGAGIVSPVRPGVVGVVFGHPIEREAMRRSIFSSPQTRHKHLLIGDRL